MYSVGSVIVILYSLIAWNSCNSTPLDDYINAPDPVFSWKRLQTYPQGTHTLYVLNMTSQRWFDETFSSRPIWWHYMTIVVPKTIRRSQTALLMVEAGTNNDRPPANNQATQLALSTGSIVIGVRQIPNQPIRFSNDPSNTDRSENGLNAWTWLQFIDSNGNDPNVLLRLPMTKAVVRAMDAAQQFLQQENIVTPQNFVVAGISKRGGITWTIPAVDKRVVGVVPIVMGLLNLRKSMMAHYRSLGGWSFAFKSQYELNVTRFLDTPNLDKIAAIEDPYSYLDRYANTQIFQIQGAGDGYFLADSEDFYWDDLQKTAGGSYLRRIPNVGHSITGYETSLLSFYLSVSDKQKLPSMTWTRTSNATHGQIRAVINHGAGQPKPNVAAGYRARTSDTIRRDFRQSKINPTTGNVVSNPVVWTNTAIILQSQNSITTIYTLTLSIPTNGYWDAAFIEVTFPGREGSTLTLTTETLILPNTYPFNECVGEACYGTLV